VFREGYTVSMYGIAKLLTLNRVHSSRRYSMLPALSFDGPLYITAQEGAYNSQDFASFINGLLDTMNPYPAKNSVIIMDNASIHKAACLRPMIEQR
jgi:hypothetical protein